MPADDPITAIDLAAEMSFSADKRVRKDLVGTGTIMVQMVCFEAGQQGVLHAHKDRDEIFLAIEGRGSLVLETGGKRSVLNVVRGQLVHVPAGTAHMARADKGERFAMLFTKSGGDSQPPP